MELELETRKARPPQRADCAAEATRPTLGPLPRDVGLLAMRGHFPSTKALPGVGLAN